MIEPIPDAPAALAALDEETALIIADYHAGFEVALQYEGLEIDSRASTRRDRLVNLIQTHGADHVIILGDIGHWIGEPIGLELEEITSLIDAIHEIASLTIVKGNHDGKLENAIDIDIAPSRGLRLGDLGLIHGHTHPAPDVLSAPFVCSGHEHVQIRLEDDVGGTRIERGWLRGQLDPDGFTAYDNPDEFTGELVVFPAFNDLVGGTYVNLPDQEFLSPFLPDGLLNPDTYLLDGTHLGQLAQLQ